MHTELAPREFAQPTRGLTEEGEDHDRGGEYIPVCIHIPPRTPRSRTRTYSSGNHCYSRDTFRSRTGGVVASNISTFRLANSYTKLASRALLGQRSGCLAPALYAARAPRMSLVTVEPVSWPAHWVYFASCVLFHSFCLSVWLGVRGLADDGGDGVGIGCTRRSRAAITQSKRAQRFQIEFVLFYIGVFRLRDHERSMAETLSSSPNV
jgi:hypothetical protein